MSGYPHRKDPDIVGGGCLLVRKEWNTGVRKYLLVKLQNGKWNIPGGNRDGNESVITTCIRETKEETRGVVALTEAEVKNVATNRRLTVPYFAIETTRGNYFAILPILLTWDTSPTMTHKMRHQRVRSRRSAYRETIDFKWKSLQEMTDILQANNGAPGFRYMVSELSNQNSALVKAVNSDNIFHYNPNNTNPSRLSARCGSCGLPVMQS
jgi:8-oxo-dGTP pyrophosphatase MutT (NUDIX family)